ncbi:hypothetical protein ASPWEDRAFT_531365 [Aspergillus wentii DTO 134E9]|uniref:Uncharacterized protein n=1 Tax=Aspergillus wentii DTO 134E9 TaxID=1073089 RepID=A0A1L9RLX7_ASPWE|nr:uncharacterized protein ASPWEDRAFT_531365 [Aspergillus wentii DTO 134E9]OJJ35837.1 hypothetical protein ASPWEDRAFT_531365 [Aspergillus wentii DTO 134E9]
MSCYISVILPIRRARHRNTTPICLSLLSHLTSQVFVVFGRFHILGFATGCPSLAVVDISPPVGIVIGVFAGSEAHFC